MPVAIPCFRVNQSTCPGFGELSRKRIPNSASGGLPPRPSLMVDIYESLIDRMGGSEQEFLNGFVSVLANSSLADAVTIIAIGIDHSQAPICLASEGEDFALRCQSGKDLSRVREAVRDGRLLQCDPSNKKRFIRKKKQETKESENLQQRTD